MAVFFSLRRIPNSLMAVFLCLKTTKLMLKLFNIFRKKPEEIIPVLPPPKLTLEPISPFYSWNITELKLKTLS
jgi:hypothetical protein